VLHAFAYICVVYICSICIHIYIYIHTCIHIYDIYIPSLCTFSEKNYVSELRVRSTNFYYQSVISVKYSMYVRLPRKESLQAA
jgi:hypothetical protein